MGLAEAEGAPNFVQTERVLIRWHPLPKLDGKSIQDGLPVLHLYRPPFSNVVERQIE